MGSSTAIEWTDCTWSPIRARVKPDAAEIAVTKGYTSLVRIAEKMAGHVGPHCEHVSPGCENCYAGTMNARCLPANGTGLPFDRRARDLVDISIDEKMIEQPLHWRKPRRAFVENQSDLFGEWVPDALIDRVFAVMALTPHITYQVLTKRAERMFEYWNDETLIDRLECATHERMDEHEELNTYLHPWPLPNVWLGVSVEDRNRKDRIDWLRKTPAAIRFLSCEPLLEDLGTLDLTGIHQVIVGGESGPGARPMHPDWARSIRDQCVAANVAFFFKQNGEYASVSEVAGPGEHHYFPDGATVRRVGKKAAGDLLDGVQWHQFPEATC